MTVATWLSSRVPAPPEALRARIAARVGPPGGSDESQVAEVCAAAASRAIAELIAGGGCARDHAVDLLAADALTTYAIEASASNATDVPREMDDMVRRLSNLVGER